MVVGIGHGLGIREYFAIDNLTQEDCVAAAIHFVNHLRLDSGNGLIKNDGHARHADFIIDPLEFVHVTAALEAELANQGHGCCFG